MVRFGGIMILSILSLLLNLGSLQAQAQTQVVLSGEQAQQMFAAQQGTCFDRIAQNVNQGLSNSFDAYQNQTNMLMDNANKRFTALKDCRTELRQAWLDFQTKKMEHQKEQNALPVRIKKAELDYQMAVLEIQQDCRTQADKDFAGYRERIYQQGPLADPTMLVDFNNRINNDRTTFYESCFRSPENRQRVNLLGQSLALAIEEIRANMKTADDALESLTEQTEAIQADVLRSCEEQEELMAYNERLAAQVAARGASVARTQMALGMISALASCQDPGRVPTNTGDTTTAPRANGNQF